MGLNIKNCLSTVHLKEFVNLRTWKYIIDFAYAKM